MQDIRSVAEYALLRELTVTWGRTNARVFRGALRSPVFVLSDAERLGAWRREERTIEISRRAIGEQPWGVIVEVLKHEMAHQYVDEVLEVHDESAHGPAFRRTCERFGIDAAARGLPTAAPAEEDGVLRRIQRLLALADSPNEHEAQAAMNAAHRLMLKHNIGYARSAAEGRYACRWLGRPKARVDSAEKVLAGILAEHFFVRAIWVFAYDAAAMRHGKVLEILGTLENLDIAAYVHGFLLDCADRLYREARARDPYLDRRRYRVGLMAGFHEKLVRNTEQCREEGLVWVGDAKLEAFAARRHPHTRRTRARVVPDYAYELGRHDGRNIVLAKAVRGDAVDRGRRLRGPVED